MSRRARNTAIGLLLAAHVLLIAFPFALARWRGYGLKSFDEPPKGQRVRFSLRQILAFTLLVAAFLGLTHWPPTTQLANEVTDYFVEIALPLLAVWASLGVGQVLARLVVLFAAATIAALASEYLTSWCIFRNFQQWLMWNTWEYYFIKKVVQVTLLAGSLLVLRAAGYRFVRQSASERAPNEPAPQAAEGIS